MWHVCANICKINQYSSLFTATQLWRRKFAEIAHDYPDLTFAVADEDDQLQLFSDFGFLESGEEFNIGILGEKDKRYPMEAMEEYDADAVRTFINNFKEGRFILILSKGGGF